MKKSILIATIVLLGCGKVSKKDAITEDSHNIAKQPFATTSEMSNLPFINKDIEESLKNAIIKGDTISYQKCYKQFVINGYDKEFLYYAILMAEKNNYKKAYTDISKILSIGVDDPKYNFSSKFGTFTMLKAYEMGDEIGKDNVTNRYIKFNKQIPKSSSIYCND
ncbi:hypothetical protein ODZ84_09740 [Chryseobacterium fluminis]|uniref:hypothetical protein n=1 Tax=Chryseobacterium fluminis TaxID=2983606 RepID=UPI00225AC76C|nr:hypothetical protein [Chryseobacterium sp. MMS21-Ot14]UZT99819.1 hypothetical protein ODZ84_09740 [Chryseobacterium sp. MMS21-Ot14]